MNQEIMHTDSALVNAADIGTTFISLSLRQVSEQFLLYEANSNPST
jgi:hypothetical protein